MCRFYFSSENIQWGYVSVAFVLFLAIKKYITQPHIAVHNLTGTAGFVLNHSVCVVKPVYVLTPGMIYAAAFSEGEDKSMISSDAYLWVQQSLIM